MQRKSWRFQDLQQMQPQTLGTIYITIIMEKVKVFLSYSHIDEELRIQLDNHLSGLRRLEIIEIWHDQKIIAGTSWKQDINTNLLDADLILCLISSDFLASDFCVINEFQQSLDRHKNEKCIIVPVILRSCDWFGVMGQIQGVPKDGKPVTIWDDKDEAFTDVVNSIKKTIDLILDRKDKIKKLDEDKKLASLLKTIGAIEKSIVARPFKSPIKGTINDLPEGYQAWIFKKPFDMNNFHPEDGPLNVKGVNWEVNLHIGNHSVGSHSGIKFELFLVLVTNQRGEELRRYIYDQNKRNLWPGLSNMDEVKILDSFIVNRE